MDLTFEWDESKARSNESKHGVSFEEARTVFNDPSSITIPDPEHADMEARWLELRLSGNQQLLVVWYTERRGRIRIIGCRKATRREESTYEQETAR